MCPLGIGNHKCHYGDSYVQAGPRKSSLMVKLILVIVDVGQDVLDLIEKPMGIIDLLDEQCKFPRVPKSNPVPLLFFCLVFTRCTHAHTPRAVCTPVVVFMHMPHASLDAHRRHMGQLQHIIGGCRLTASILPRCRCMQASTSDYANKLYTTPVVTQSSRFSKPKTSQTAFTIDHYAGQVPPRLSTISTHRY